MLKEFKEFAMRGNVLDMAVGVVVGGAFGKIVTSLVNDLIMPAVGMLVGKVDFSDLKVVISPAQGDVAEVAIRYGAFIQTILDFLIVAFSIFLFIQLISKLRKKKEEAEEAEEEAAPPEPTNEELLLTEIRDLLKENQSKES